MGNMKELSDKEIVGSLKQIITRYDSALRKFKNKMKGIYKDSEKLLNRYGINIQRNSNLFFYHIDLIKKLSYLECLLNEKVINTVNKNRMDSKLWKEHHSASELLDILLDNIPRKYGEWIYIYPFYQHFTEIREIPFIAFLKLLDICINKRDEYDKARRKLAEEGLLLFIHKLCGVFKEIDYEIHKKIVESFKKDKRNLGPYSVLMFILIHYPDLIFFRDKPPYDISQIHSDLLSNKKDRIKKAVKALKEWKPIIDYFEAFEAYHSFLYYSDKFYRDHIKHSIRVMWLMQQFADKWKRVYRYSILHRIINYTESFNNSYNLKKLGEDDVIKSLIYSPLGILKLGGTIIKNLEEALEIIYVDIYAQQAGLFHDLLYPVSSFIKEGIKIPDKFEEEIKGISGIKIPVIEDEDAFSRLSVEFDNSGVDEVCYKNYYFSTWLKNNEFYSHFKKNWYDHGVLTSLMCKSFPSEVRQAIALHNLKQVEFNILDNPIAFYLILSDEIQEWGRVILTDDGEDYILVDEIKWCLTENSLCVEIDLPEDIKKKKKDFDIEKFIGDKAENLGRMIIPKELELDIEINITSNNDYVIKYDENRQRLQLQS